MVYSWHVLNSQMVEETPYPINKNWWQNKYFIVFKYVTICLSSLPEQPQCGVMFEVWEMLWYIYNCHRQARCVPCSLNNVIYHTAIKSYVKRTGTICLKLNYSQVGGYNYVIFMSLSIVLYDIRFLPVLEINL